MEHNKDTAQLLDSTTVKEVDVNLDEIFGNPGAENIMLPDTKEEEKPKSVFSNTNNIDLSFIDKTADDGKTIAEKVEEKKEGHTHSLRNLRKQKKTEKAKRQKNKETEKQRDRDIQIKNKIDEAMSNYYFGK